jgi:hypothetical protein
MGTHQYILINIIDEERNSFLSFSGKIVAKRKFIQGNFITRIYLQCFFQIVDRIVVFIFIKELHTQGQVNFVFVFGKRQCLLEILDRLLS